MRCPSASLVVAVAALAVPSGAAAKTIRTSFQLVQSSPSRVYADTSFIPFALPDPVNRVYRYTTGPRTFVGPWIPAAVGGGGASDLLGRITKDKYSRQGAATRGVVVDRPLTTRERGSFTVLAELYREADVLVLAAGHPACAGLTQAQARSIARGTTTRWSQLVAGAKSDAIRVRYPAGASGGGEPHLGTRIVNFRSLNYARGAVGAPDGGVAAAARGDQSIAAITTWSRVRARLAGVCVVPLNGVAPSDGSVTSLRYAEAFPVSYVVLRSVPGLSAEGRAQVAVMRRAMGSFLRSARLRGLLRARGLLVGDGSA